MTTAGGNSMATSTEPTGQPRRGRLRSYTPANVQVSIACNQAGCDSVLLTDGFVVVDLADVPGYRKFAIGHAKGQPGHRVDFEVIRTRCYEVAAPDVT